MIGSFIGGCRLVELIGEGGFGTVYRAIQVSLDRTVAIKLLRPGTASDADVIRSFAAEARLAGKLEHPNIIRTYYYGHESGTYFVVMEYLDGGTLDKVLAADGRLPVDAALRVARQIASALDHAHRQGIVHGDLNPRNIIVAADGRAVVGDFLGCPLEESGGRSVVGVPEYVSPEQARGMGATPRSDMYSLGVVLYEMLTGRPPFSETSPSDTLFRHISSDPVPPSNWNKAIPARLNKLILRLLSKNPDVRPESCEAVAKELEGIEKGLRAGSAKRQEGERRPLSPVLVAALILALAGLGAVGYHVQRSVAQERELESLTFGSSSASARSAKQAFEQSVIVRYNNEMQLAQNMLDRRQFRAAATAFHRASKLRPDQVDPHLFLASIFIERDDFETARSELEAVLRLDPGNNEAKTAMNYVRTKLPRE